jgi:hypothetical protein
LSLNHLEIFCHDCVPAFEHTSVTKGGQSPQTVSTLILLCL